MSRLAPYALTLLPGVTAAEVDALVHHLTTTYSRPVVVHDRRTP